MKTIGIATVFAGYNYGSALQAFALKTVVQRIGYKATIIRLQSSNKARDIRLKKIVTIIFRSIVHPKAGIEVIKGYLTSINRSFSTNSVNYFTDFYSNAINPMQISTNELRKLAYTDEYCSFICGSDQIWNASAMYVNPFYYLQFAPRNKRIAYAPSFGRDTVPKYNYKLIKKYISSIPLVSVRETSGQSIVKSMTGRNVPVVADPCLLLTADEWVTYLNLKKSGSKKYILAYFIDKPSIQSLDLIKELDKEVSCSIYSIYNTYPIPKAKYIDAGPKEFLELLYNAEYVVTDSFHGAVFSIIMNKEFYVFPRESYSDLNNQETRVLWLLNKYQLQDRYCAAHICHEIQYDMVNEKVRIDSESSSEVLKTMLQEDLHEY